MKKKERERGGMTYQIDELGEFELDADREDVRIVHHGPDDLVVIGEEVVVEPLRVRIPSARRMHHHSEEQESHHHRQNER